MARRWLPLAAALPPLSGASEGMLLHSLADVDREAVCGDGTPAGYYWEEGAEGSHLWVVYLDGGHWCYSDQSCLSRCRSLGDHKCSSRHWPAAKRRGTAARCETGQVCGIFAPAQSAELEGANKVFVPSCSSDAFLGDADAFGLHMRGSRIVRAVLQDLVFSHGLGRGAEGRGKRDTLLFGGGSAGARGAMAHLDYVGSMLKSASRNVNVVGFLDSPLWVDLAFPGSSAVSLANQTRAVYEAANVVHLGSRCLAHFGRAEGWKCIFGEHRLPFVKTPFLLVASQSCLFQLMWNLQQKPTSPPQLSFATAFAGRVSTVVEMVSSPMHHVLSWSCWNHDLSLTGRFSTDSVGGVTMEIALQRFLALDGVNSSNTSYIDSCEGFACGTGCGGVHGAQGEVSIGKPLPKPQQHQQATPLPKPQQHEQAAPLPKSQQHQQAASSAMPLSEFRRRVQGALKAQGRSSEARGDSADSFSMLDSDRNGTLEHWELEGVADWLGSEISERQASYAFQMMDTNADGRLSPDEFGLVEDGNGPPISVVDLKSRIADTYSSPGEAIKDMGAEPIGRSRFAEVAEAFQQPLTAEQADYAFDGLDVDRDGSLTTYEIMSVLDGGQFYPDERNLRLGMSPALASASFDGAVATAKAAAARERAEPHGAPPATMAVAGAALGLLLLPLSYVALLRGLKGPSSKGPSSPPSERSPPGSPASPLASRPTPLWTPPGSPGRGACEPPRARAGPDGAGPGRACWGSAGQGLLEA